MTMRAVIWRGPALAEIAEVAEPTLSEPTDALVRVTLSAICGTDLHAFTGHMDGVEPGAVLGHEFVGDVVATGSAVRRVRTGDHVMASDFSACGVCWWCDAGVHWACPERRFFGTGTAFGPPLPGAQAELVRVPHADTTLHPLPPGCCDEAGLLIGDNLATGWVAVERAQVAAGDTVAVVGGGAVGQLVSLAAQTVGASVVVAVDPVDARRALAARNGALDATPEQARALIDELTDGRGADAVVEAVGSTVGLRLALALVRAHGVVVSVGTHRNPSWEFPLGDAFARELTLRFAIGDSIGVRRQLLRLVERALLDPTVVITDRIPFADAIQGYRRLAERRSLKIVLGPAG